MSASVQDTLNLIVKGDYMQAQQQLKELIALFPHENELYNLYSYCNKCIEDICEKENIEPEEKPAKPLEQWQEWRKMAGELANKGDYHSASNLLGLIWNTPAIIPPHIFLPHLRQPSALLLHDRTICDFLRGEPDHAKANYEHAIQIELNQLHTHSPNRISFLLKIKNYEEALRLFKIAIHTASPSDRPDVYYKRYHLHKTLGETDNATHDLQKALRCLDMAINLRPLFYDLYHKHAKWLAEQGNFDKALQENTKAIALWPNFYGYHIQRAEILARLGQTAKAREELAEVEKGTMCRLESCRPAEKAHVYELLGETEKAEELYRSENIYILARYDNLYDFYERQGRKKDIVKLRETQRKEADFRNRVSERELRALF